MLFKRFIHRWGVNLQAVYCARCSQKMRFLRLPRDFDQLLWGGWTCPNCKCRMNKWGEPTATQPRQA